MFGSAACIGGMDGAGKGMLATAMALAMITGYPLLGEKVWRTGPVAIITYEDDQDEWERRIAAACLHYSQNGYALDYETLIGSFYFLHKPGGRVTLAERTKENGLQFPDTARIVHFLKEISAVMLIIDPFNSAHAMEDGNNNVAIAAVAQEITAIAQQAHVAALLLHHLRKGATGTVDDLMGAVALRANFRSVRILQVASEGDALGLGIPTAEAWRYLWVAGTKENYAPPPLERLWFHKASEKLNNPAGIYELGDEVGAIGRWTPPAAFEGLDYASLRAVFDALAAGPHSRGQARQGDPLGRSTAHGTRRSERRTGHQNPQPVVEEQDARPRRAVQDRTAARDQDPGPRSCQSGRHPGPARHGWKPAGNRQWLTPPIRALIRASPRVRSLRGSIVP